VILEKKVPEFDDIQNVLLDSYALIFVAYGILVKGDAADDDEHGHATVVLQHGVNLLKQAADQFEDANSRLCEFCRENNLTQGRAS
jgi:hypothetical protein